MQKSVHFDEFLDCVRDLVNSEIVCQMENFSHHAHVNCLEHSISVAYASFLFCKRMGWDARSAARGGLLHDLFLYDWRVKGSHEGMHGFTHPRAAYENARKHFVLNPLEKEIILAHMFPMGFHLPKHGESLTVCMMDKICAISEAIGFFRHIRLSRRVEEIRACPSF